MKRSPRSNGLMMVMLLLALMVLPATQVRADEIAPGEGTDRWWGALGAALCGAEIRLATTAPAIGMNPYVMAAGVAGCLIALLDIATT